MASKIITEAEFLEVVNSGKRPPEVVYTPNRQMIVYWRVLDKGEPTPLIVKVYTSIFGDPGYGKSRPSGKDSIRIALVDDTRDVGIGKATLTQRTDGWEERLIQKIKYVFKQGVEELQWRKSRKEQVMNQNCPNCQCGAKMRLRTARKGFNKGSKFWGCSNYPECRHTLDENAYIPTPVKDQPVVDIRQARAATPPKPKKPKTFAEAAELRSKNADWAI